MYDDDTLIQAAFLLELYTEATVPPEEREEHPLCVALGLIAGEVGPDFEGRFAAHLEAKR